MVLGGCADKLLLFPQTGEARPVGASRHVLPGPDGGELEVWIAPPAERFSEPAAYLLAFNGNADRAENAVVIESHFWNQHAVEVWAVNYPGYGGSTGPARLRALGPAGLAAFDALRAHAGDKPIIVAGNSLGTTVALHIAARRDVSGITLMNPPPLRQLIFGRFGWWNLWLLAGPVAMGVPSDLDSLANAARTSAPAVVILSTLDEVVPYKYQLRVHDALAGPKQAVTLIANHNGPLTPEDEVELRQKLSWLFEQATSQKPEKRAAEQVAGESN